MAKGDSQIFSTVIAWFKPVTFVDDNETRMAYLLRPILFTLSFLSIVLTPISNYMGFSELQAVVTVGIMLTGVAYLGLWELVRQGRVYFVSWSVCLLHILLATGLMLSARQLMISFISIYFVSIVLATLLLNSWAILTMVGLSLGSWLLALYIETETLFVEIMAVEYQFEHWFANGVTFMVIAILLDVARVSISRGFLADQQTQIELAKQNDLLQKRRESLQTEIVERTKSIESTLKEAEYVQIYFEQQMWLTTGKTQLSDVMRGEQNKEQLASAVINHLCQYMGAPVGSLFAYENETLAWLGGFAHQPTLTKIDVKQSDNMLSEVVRTQRIQSFTEPPTEQLPIVTGFIRSAPKHIIVAPFTYKNEVMGVLQMGRNQSFTEQEKKFFEQISESVGLAFYMTYIRQHMNKLLLNG